ncbi:reverse transcriptase domain-containing protein [Tanacetum coccineum]
MPTNIALYNGSTDPADHLNRFVGAANSGEWPMPVWCRMFQQTLDGSARGWFESLSPNSIDEWWRLREAFTTRYSTRKACYKEPHEITKIVRKANETLTAFKERWTQSVFASNVPKTVNEMMKRLDEFVRAEEAYALAELPPGESRDIHRRLSFPAGSRDVHQRLTFQLPEETTETKATRNRLRIGKAESLDERPEAEGGKKTKQKPSSAEGSSWSHFEAIAIENLPEKVRAGLRETRTDLVGFAGEAAKPLGKINLEVRFGNEGLSRRTSMKFHNHPCTISLKCNTCNQPEDLHPICQLFHSMIQIFQLQKECYFDRRYNHKCRMPDSEKRKDDMGRNAPKEDACLYRADNCQPKLSRPYGHH